MPSDGAAYSASGALEGYEIFIKYLPPDTTEASLLELFQEAGEIVGPPRLMTDSHTGKCKGVGWITFATPAGLAKALTWDGYKVGGRSLSVQRGKAVHTGLRPSVQAPGTHTPALLHEVVAKLVGSERSGTFVDATFGRGGHTRGLLEALTPNARMHAFDMDPEAISAGKELERADSRFAIHHAPFSSMAATLRPLGVRPTAVLFDLGISSPQFDEAHRGFRPEADGPLDLRFDQGKGVPAWQWLETVERMELIRVLHEYGETSDLAAARRIADAICLARAEKALPRRTREFASLVAEAKGKEYQAMHPAKLAFQALRVHLNDEFGEARAGLRAAFDLLDDGGRIGVITWKHSECALVVDFFRGLEGVRAECPLRRWYAQQPSAAPPPTESWSLSMDDATRPSERELATNSRSRSAVLHVLRKQRVPPLAELERLAYARLGWAAPTDAGAPSTGALSTGALGTGAATALGSRSSVPPSTSSRGAAEEGSSADKSIGSEQQRKEARKAARKAERAAAAAAAAAAGTATLEESPSERKQKKKKKRKEGDEDDSARDPDSARDSTRDPDSAHDSARDPEDEKKRRKRYP